MVKLENEWRNLDDYNLNTIFDRLRSIFPTQTLVVTHSVAASSHG